MASKRKTTKPKLESNEDETETDYALEGLEFDPKKDTIHPSTFNEAVRKLSLEQEHAIELASDPSELFVGFTGGAGTGKTTVLGELTRELRRKRISFVLCAPTGRAAKRVQELTGIPAVTIHRLLEFPMPEEGSDGEQLPNRPHRDRQLRFEQRCIIVDEASMVSPTLYGQLMDALRNDGFIRFIGDNNQLPPVEKGIPPFIDVLKRYPSVELSFNYRSDDEIVANAGRILSGRIPQRNARFEIIYTDRVIDTLLEFVQGHKEFARDDHQIITPTRKGVFGTDRINPSLQVRFNPRGPLLKLDRYEEMGKDGVPKFVPPIGVRAGDKYLWIKNDYKLNMFNGEIGRIESLDTEQGCLTLTAGERRILVEPRVKMFSPYHGTVINYDPRKQIEHGYAVTTHKSQGSEFDVVVYVMARGQMYLLNKRNFYTAITRAKKQVVIICDPKSMQFSLRPYQMER